MIRPTSCTAQTCSTTTVPEAGVDRDLRDLAAPRVDRVLVAVERARAGALDGRLAEPVGELGVGAVERVVARLDAAAAQHEVVGRDLEVLAGEVEQRAAHAGRRGAHRRA